MDELHEKVIEALKSVFDPEIPVNIYDLGLIYNVEITPEKVAKVRMTLTSPSCPAAETLPPEVEQKVAAIEGIEDSIIYVVWDPPWTPDMMSEEAKLELNMY